MRASLLGAIDGVISSFSVIAGADAANANTRIVFVVGAASVVADALSMGTSEYLSSSAEGAPQAGLLGLACSASFAIAGSVPLVAYLATAGNLLSTAAFAFVELVLLGALRGGAEGRRFPAALQTAGLGVAAGAVGYAVGVAVEALSSNA